MPLHTNSRLSDRFPCVSKGGAAQDEILRQLSLTLLSHLQQQERAGTGGTGGGCAGGAAAAGVGGPKGPASGRGCS